LKNLGFRVPLAIVNKAHQANQLYPFAISLIESVRTYERSLEKLDNRPKIVLLLAGLHKEVQNLVAEGIGLVWESYKLDPYVQRFVYLYSLINQSQKYIFLNHILFSYLHTILQIKT
jgi:dynein heavy chain 1